MKKLLLATFSSILIFIFLLIFFTLYGRLVRYNEVCSALELSMKHAIAQIQFEEGTPASEEEWLNDFAQSLALQIESTSHLTIHIYEANLQKGLLSAEAILTFQNPIGTISSVTTKKRTIILEEYYETETSNHSFMHLYYCNNTNRYYFP